MGARCKIVRILVAETGRDWNYLDIRMRREYRTIEMEDPRNFISSVCIFVIRHERSIEIYLRATGRDASRWFLITRGTRVSGRRKAAFSTLKKTLVHRRERLKSPFVSKLENAEALVSAGRGVLL